MSINTNAWDSLRDGHCPRIWLILEEKNLLLHWEAIDQITASNDFLNLKFDCEYGHIQISSTESLQPFFEDLQLERVRMIDGRKLKVKILFAG